MNIEQRSLTEIQPYPNNPRKNDAAVDVVVASIKEFGFQVPIVVDRDYVIITGHTRYEAAKKLGMDSVPVVIASELSEAKAKAYRIMDNKSAEASSWDVDKLLVEIDSLESLDCNMDSLGFNLDELDNLRHNDAPPFSTNTTPRDEYELEDDEREERPNFNPSLNPDMSGKQVTDKDLDHAKHKLDYEQGNTRKSMGVICPECYAEFEVGV